MLEERITKSMKFAATMMTMDMMCMMMTMRMMCAAEKTELSVAYSDRG